MNMKKMLEWCLKFDDILYELILYNFNLNYNIVLYGILLLYYICIIKYEIL